MCTYFNRLKTMSLFLIHINQISVVLKLHEINYNRQFYNTLYLKNIQQYEMKRYMPEWMNSLGKRWGIAKSLTPLIFENHFSNIL